MKLQRILAAFALLAATACAHAVGRLADVQVYDRASGRELPVYWHGGRPYVVGQPGNEYQVVVRNRRGEDLLAVVSVDGVNVLSGETASPDQGGYVLAPWRRVEIAGWRKSLDEVAAFYFTSLGDSYAARTGRPANVGVIGVALFQRARASRPPWQEIAPEAKREDSRGANGPAPMQESRAQAGAPEAPAKSALADSFRGIAPSAPLGTGHGRREDSPVRYVEFERASAEPAERIALYYDSYPNLVAQGVIGAPRGARHPDPFPAGFVPDPS